MVLPQCVPTRRSAGFYTLFSMAPMLIILTTIVGAAYGEQAASGEITGQISALLGEQAAQAVTEAVSRSRTDEAITAPACILAGQPGTRSRRIPSPSSTQFSRRSSPSGGLTCRPLCIRTRFPFRTPCGSLPVPDSPIACRGVGSTRFAPDRIVSGRNLCDR